MQPRIDRWLDESGVRDAAILPGMIDGDDRIGLLRDADLFVLQSHTENFGISVVEAMAAGTPVVISDQINLWRDVVEYDAGLVTPCDPDLAAEAMLKAMEDKTLRAKLLNGGEKLLSERYSREAVTQQLMSLYRDVARK
jgi:glycosyltransferase involved in cell wall biosynthesis